MCVCLCVGLSVRDYLLGKMSEKRSVKVKMVKVRVSEVVVKVRVTVSLQNTPGVHTTVEF